MIQIIPMIPMIQMIQLTPGSSDLRVRTPNENEQILASLGKNKQNRICPFFARFRAKNGQKRAKNGRTKPNPGETGQNRKFRRILIRDCHSLVDTDDTDYTESTGSTESTESTEHTEGTRGSSQSASSHSL